SKVEHFGFQLEDLVDLDSLVGVPVIPPRSAYELHVFLKPRIWNPGMSINAALSGTDGLRLGLDYKGEGLFHSQDRWRAGAQVGGKLRKHIVDDSGYLALTRAIGDIQWMAPPIAHGHWRPTFQLRSDLVTRQRRDLELESYTYVRSNAAFLM